MKRVFFFLLLILSILWISPFIWASTTITLKDKVIVDSENVYLGDIAFLNGELRGSLSRVRIVTSPIPGKEREIEKKYIVLRLRQLGYSDNEVVISGPEKIVVRRAYQEISTQLIEKLVRERIKDIIPKWAKRYEASLNIPGFSKFAPIGDIDVFVDIPTFNKIKGRIISFPVIINIDGRKWKKLYITVNLILYADVPIAITSIKRGEKISKGDYKIEERRIERASFPYISPNKISGYVALRNIYPGNIIDLTYISRPYEVKRGEIVDVILKRGVITIMLKAQALENGNHGDIIQLKNLKSGKKFTGIVKDFGLVIVK